MGESQSKFSPEPKDVWYKMIGTGKEPKYLQSVLQAITDLRESTGSSQGRIIDFLRSTINKSGITPQPRNLAMQVKRALQYAAIHGMVRQHGGKYVLTLNEKDFEIFKGLRAENPLTEITSKKNKNKAKKIRRKSANAREKRSYKRKNKIMSTVDDNNNSDDKKSSRSTTNKLLETASEAGSETDVGRNEIDINNIGKIPKK